MKSNCFLDFGRKLELEIVSDRRGNSLGMTGLVAALLTAIFSLFVGLFALALQAAVMISGRRGTRDAKLAVDSADARGGGCSLCRIQPQESVGD